MTTVQVTVVVTDAAGLSTSFSGTLESQQKPVIDAVDIVPQSAPAGTTRTITVTAHSPDNRALSFDCSVNGVPATPVAGSPNKFQVVV